MTERWAPSSAIRERARFTHPAKPEPTVDDVLWYMDEQAKELRSYALSVKKAFESVRRAFHGRSARRRARDG
jgi:hypothetical protein